jgi:hypothetical protein
MRISSYPREFAQIITVEISAGNENDCIITLSNRSGRILKMMGVTLVKGKNNILLDKLESLSAGLYLLDVKDLGGQFAYHAELTKQ